MIHIARIVVPGSPHHVTQRGNRREPIFFEDGDYALYRDWLAQSCRIFGVAVWAYCQMPNHVHLVLTRADASGLARARQTGLPVSGALWLGRAGRRSSDGRRALCRAESGADAACGQAQD